MNLSDRDLVIIYVGLTMHPPADQELAAEVNYLCDRLRDEFNRRHP